MSEAVAEPVSPSAKMGVLVEEHAALGASFCDRNGWLAVRGYPCSGEGAAVLVADLTGADYRLLHGTGAAACARRALGVPAPRVGRCLWLQGEGDGPRELLVRCGDEELVVLCLAETPLRPAGPDARAVAGPDQAVLEDATSLLTPLLMAGPGARAVLADYLRGQALPAPFEVSQLRLDAVLAVCASVDGRGEAFLLLVPPPRARVLWRSFLSFTEVTPVGLESVRALGLM